MTTPTVAILGCGPAGLMAAAACESMDVEFSIFSKKEKSVLGGSQYLHAPVPFCGEPFQLEIVHRGEPREYARKVYGAADKPTSWDDFDPGVYEVYDLRETYERLWERYFAKIYDADVTADRLLSRISTGYDIVVSSVPKNILCKERHTFRYQTVFVVRQGYQDMALDLSGPPRSVVTYSGESDVDWYRASIINGEKWFEFSHRRDGAREVHKPLSNNCTCHEFFMVGRYGRWEKGVLSHTAYEEVCDLLTGEQHARLS